MSLEILLFEYIGPRFITLFYCALVRISSLKIAWHFEPGNNFKRNYSSCSPTSRSLRKYHRILLFSFCAIYNQSEKNACALIGIEYMYIYIYIYREREREALMV